MLDVLYTQIRSVLEIAVAVWKPYLTKTQSKQLERVQQCAFYIIMGSYYNNYDSEKLCVRRTQLCLSFALKCEKNKKFQNLFALSKVNEVPTKNEK